MSGERTGIRTVLGILCTTCCTTCFLPAASAQEQVLPQPADTSEADPAPAGAPHDLADLTLEELLDIRLDTGSFLDLDLRRSPASVTIISREQIESSGARHLGELLEIFVPGFQYMYNKWNGDIWGMRGVAADRNTKAIFLVNGLEMNTEARDGAATETNLGLLDDIERVEVLRGPAGLVYGSGAIAGVINVITRVPERSGGTASLDMGLHGAFQGQALSHAQLGEGHGLTVAAGFRRHDGLGDRASRIYGNVSYPGLSSPVAGGVPGDGNAWATPGNYRMSADYRLGSFRFYTRFTHQVEAAGALFAIDPWPEMVGPPGADAPSRTVDGSPQPPGGPFGTVESWGANRRVYVQDNLSAHASYDLPIGPDTLSAELACVGNTNRIETEGRKGYDAPESTIDSSMGERRYFVQASYLMRRVGGLQAVLGLQYRLDDLGEDLEGHNTHGGQPLHPDISPVVYQSLAGYGEAHYSLTDELQLMGGLRADQHTRTGVVLNPRVAAVWSPSRDHAIKAVFQTSANNGSVDNYEYNWRHYDDHGKVIADVAHLEYANDPTSAKIPAVSKEALHDLRPEKVISGELASEHRILPGLHLAPSLSYTSIDDLFAWNQTLFRMINAGRYDFISLEADLRYDRRWISGGISHAFQRPVRSSGQTVYHDIPSMQPVDNGDGTYRLEPDGTTQRVAVNAVRDSVSADGSHFLNLATHSTKLFLTCSPLPWLHLHGNARIFWGLPGRTDMAEADTALGWDYLDVQSNPIVKLNLGVRVDLQARLRLSVFVHDLLGSADSLAAVRWQQMAEPSQRDLYTVDQRTVVARLEALLD